MKFSAFGGIIALAFISVAAAAQIPNTNTAQDTCQTKSDCRCDGMAQGNFCGDHAAHPNCLDGHLYSCNMDGTTCDLGLNDSCRK